MCTFVSEIFWLELFLRYDFKRKIGRKGNEKTLLFHISAADTAACTAAAASECGDRRYAKAVDWTFANGITTGMDYGAFGPDTACTRAQIVTFLYRAR